MMGSIKKKPNNPYYVTGDQIKNFNDLFQQAIEKGEFSLVQKEPSPPEIDIFMAIKDGLANDVWINGLTVGDIFDQLKIMIQQGIIELHWSPDDNYIWDQLFAKSQGKWSEITNQVIVEDDAGLTEGGGFYIDESDLGNYGQGGI